MTAIPFLCRCGWEGAGVHKCHRCSSQEGSLRLFAAPDLVGVEYRPEPSKIWSCDECWGLMQPNPDGLDVTVADLVEFARYHQNNLTGDKAELDKAADANDVAQLRALALWHLSAVKVLSEMVLDLLGTDNDIHR